MAKFNQSKGMKTHDSLQRYQREPEIFLTIRHHGFPALQKNPPIKVSEKGRLSQMEKVLEEKVAAGETSFGSVASALGGILKYLVIAVLFPLDLLFSIAPQWFAKTIFPVIAKFLNMCIGPIIKCIDYIKGPIGKAILHIIACKNKVQHIFSSWFSRLYPIFTKFNDIIKKIYYKVVWPLSFVSEKMTSLVNTCFHFFAWSKIFAKHSFSYALDSREKLLQSLEVSEKLNEIKDNKELFADESLNVEKKEKDPELVKQMIDPAVSDDEDFLDPEENFDLSAFEDDDLDEDDEEETRNAELELWDALGKQA